MHIFARLTKVDEAQRTVTGVIANEALDRSGEVFDYDSSKPHFEKWSGDIAKATEGKSVGNVRAMHGNVCAGITKSITFDDVAKAIEVEAKIVDDNEWNKTLAGCYTGFSIGGSYARKWKGEDGVQRYTADPYEYSLVDLPCNPDAQFSVIKSDGAEEMRKFVTTTDNTEALAKWAGNLTEEERASLLAKIAPAEVVDEVVEAAPVDESEILLLAAGGDLVKAMDVADTSEAFKKWRAAFSDLEKATAELDASKLEKVSIQYAELLTKATPPKGVVKVISKDVDADHATLNKLDDTPVLRKDGSVDHEATTLKLMKIAHGR
jgi:hypothetical protein